MKKQITQVTSKDTGEGMKRTIEENNVCSLEKSKSKLKDLWDRQASKVKNGKFTCPLCKEVFTGLSAMGAHLKDHCT